MRCRYTFALGFSVPGGGSSSAEVVVDADSLDEARRAVFDVSLREMGLRAFSVSDFPIRVRVLPRP